MGGGSGGSAGGGFGVLNGVRFGVLLLLGRRKVSVRLCLGLDLWSNDSDLASGGRLLGHRFRVVVLQFFRRRCGITGERATGQIGLGRLGSELELGGRAGLADIGQSGLGDAPMGETFFGGGGSVVVVAAAAINLDENVGIVGEIGGKVIRLEGGTGRIDG